MRVLVIEEHTEALECLSLAARRGVLPIGVCQLVHFDSHPDLSCLECIEPEHIQDRVELCHRLRNSEDGISTFILPSVAMGLLKSVVWVRPPWSTQIPSGHHPLTFGWTDGGKGKMSVCTQLPYWADDGLAVSDAALLSHTATVDLRVQQIDEWVSTTQLATPTSVQIKSPRGEAEPSPKCRALETHTVQQCWVLDVCLDYFSCANPLQQPEQPEHISTPEEIVAMLAAFQAALMPLRSNPPKFCIIARSEEDGFTPDAVALSLEAGVIAAIGEAFGAPKVMVVKSFEDFYDIDWVRRF